MSVVGASSSPASASRAPTATAQPETHLTASAGWLEDAIFGSLDGVVTSLALAVSVAGVLHLDHYATFLTIVAAATAGALSMFVGGLLSARAKAGLVRRERRREEQEVVEKPDEETAEVRQIFRAQGFSPEEVEILVRGVTKDPKRWVDFMMRDELGLAESSDPAPLRHGAIIGLSFLIAGLLPAFAFLSHSLAVSQELYIAVGIGISELVTVGILQARYTDTSRWRGAAEILLFGLGAAAAVFLITLGLQPGS